MTDNNTSSETPTRKEKPEKWAGPSFAVWTYNQRWKEQGRAGLFIAGYYKNLVDWERHDHHSSFSLLEESGELSNFALSEIEHSDYTLIEKDEDNEYDKTSKLLRNILFLNQTTVKEAYDFGIEGRDPSMLVTDRTVEAILSKIPVFDSISPSDNRLPKLPEPLEGYELLDLAATDFSNKSDADTAISFCRRRCRLLIGPKVTLCVWESPIPEDTVNKLWLSGANCYAKVKNILLTQTDSRNRDFEAMFHENISLSSGVWQDYYIFSLIGYNSKYSI